MRMIRRRSAIKTGAAVVAGLAFGAAATPAAQAQDRSVRVSASRQDRRALAAASPPRYREAGKRIPDHSADCRVASRRR